MKLLLLQLEISFSNFKYENFFNKKRVSILNENLKKKERKASSFTRRR